VLAPSAHSTGSAPEVVASPAVGRGPVGAREGIVALEIQPGAFPEVIVSPDEQRALQTLLRIVEEGQLPALPESATQKQPLAPIHLEVTDLVVEPLRIARLETGELQ
jgi:hypothetical protein